MTSILMVCLGNICRSPLAEGILRAKLPEHDFHVDSAGTANYHVGNAPDKRSIETAKKHGITIHNLKARQFVGQDFNKFDYIYVMDRANLRNVLNLAKSDQDRRKVSLILNEISSGEPLEVPDPYYGAVNGFENVYEMLNTACDLISRRLKV